MKKYIVLLTCLLFVSFATNAQTASMVKVEPVKPYQYEKRSGKLYVKGTIEIPGGSAKSFLATFGNNTLEAPVLQGDNKAEVWLPLIGEPQLFSVYNKANNTLLVSQMYSPLIPPDWGYFQKGTIHIIQSSHQDIGWMDTPDVCREDRIEKIINPALEMMKADDTFTFEMEQTLNLMEFLDKYPERKEEIIQRYKEKRFYWGATYNQPYEGLSSGEQLVRQAYYGRKWIRENLPECDDRTANNIDVPGRTWQFPQIMEKSGIKNLFISRMGEGMYDWYSPDGSKVFTYSPGNYGWATMIWKFFDDGAVNAFNKLHHRSALWSDYFKNHNIPPHYSVLISCDATKPINFKKVIDEWNWIADNAEISLPRLTNSTSEEYFEIVNAPTAKLEEVHGERPDLWLYIHGPAHYQATCMKREAGVLLPAAETFKSFDAVLNNDLKSYPRAAFDRAWMASIYPDHGLGGKNGEITDKVFQDSLTVGRNIGAGLLNDALLSITQKVKAKKNDVIVFNDLTWKRTGIAIAELDETLGNNVMVKDDKGAVVPSQLVDNEGKKSVAFMVSDIPSMGYKTYTIAKGKSVIGLPEGVKQASNYYENKYYKVILSNGGIVSLYDKELNKELLQTEKFKGGDILDAGYTGNGAGEFTQIKPLEPSDLSTLSTYPALWACIETGALFTVFENIQQTPNAKVVQYIKLYHSLKKIDFNVSLVDFNGAHNRQYRIAFPLNMDEQHKINYEVPMAVLEVGRDEMKTAPMGWAWFGSYTHKPEESHPREVQNFISSHGNGFGFTMSSCVAVADYIDPSREQANYPVLQGILLSSHKSCHGEGNWYHQTGTHHYSFSVSSHPEGWKNGYHFGIEANHPLQVVKKNDNKGSLPKEDSFLEISDPFVALSLIKKADNDTNLIIRLTEMEGKDKTVKVKLPIAVKKVVRTNLIEDEQEELPTSGKEITLQLGHHAIETYKLIL